MHIKVTACCGRQHRRSESDRSWPSRITDTVHVVYSFPFLDGQSSTVAYKVSQRKEALKSKQLLVERISCTLNELHRIITGLYGGDERPRTKPRDRLVATPPPNSTLFSNRRAVTTSALFSFAPLNRGGGSGMFSSKKKKTRIQAIASVAVR